MAEHADVEAAEHALERLFRLAANRRMQPHQTAAVGVDVSRVGYAVLRCVDEAGELTLGDVARQCAMDPAAASRQVKLLEDEGLLRRATAADDARVNTVQLTADGRRVYRKIVAFRTAYMARVLASWSRADRQALTRLVDRLVDDFGAVPVREPRGSRGSR
jgi:DNA-binding MarR family transcriptional regulator